MPEALLRASAPTGAALAIGLALGLTPGPAQGAGSPRPLLPHSLQEVTVDTLEGGRILVRNAAPGRGGGPDEWRLVEELRLGEVDGAGPEVFGNVHEVTVDGRGNIYVLDVGSKEVRVFDREGLHLRNIARGGEGPGEVRYREFSSAQRIVFQPPNRLWIGDGFQQLSFDSLGNELSRVGGGFRGPRSRVVDADADGFVYQQVRVSERTTSGDQTVSHSRTYGVRLPVYPEHPNPVLPRDSVVFDSQISTSTVQTRSGSGGNVAVTGTFRVPVPRRVWAFAGGETVWVANRAVQRFHEVTFAGDTVRTIELGNPPSPPPDDSDESEFKPLIAGLEVSPEGWLWVRRHPEDVDEDPTWDLFDNCGRFRGEVSTPARLQVYSYPRGPLVPMDVGPRGIVHGIARDALDISYVLRLRLESTSGTPVTAEACRW